MKITIRTQQSSSGIEYPDALGTYQKGDFLCVFFTASDGIRRTHKYPIQNIFRIEEDYPSTDKGAKS